MKLKIHPSQRHFSVNSTLHQILQPITYSMKERQKVLYIEAYQLKRNTRRSNNYKNLEIINKNHD